MAYQAIGEGAMLLHFAFLAYVAFGGFLAWRWPRTLWIHVPIAAYGFGIAVIGWICPLTHVENWARENAGQEGYQGTGFIEHYLSGIIYPQSHLIVFEFMVGISVALSWIGFLILWRRRHRPTPRRHINDGTTPRA